MDYRVRRESYTTGAIATTVAPNEPWELYEFRVHLDAGGGATDLTVTISSGVSSRYNTVLYTKAMNGVADADYRWDPAPKLLHKDDKVVVAYANGGNAVWAVEVIYKLLGQESI